MQARSGLALGLVIATTMLLASVASASDEDDLTAMLHQFLAGASAGDVAAHENFWHDELIYTSSNGTRTNKANILEAVRGAPPSDDGPSVVYTAEDVQVKVYGDTAIVAFKLVGTPQGDAADQGADEYFNTGTFRRQGDGWNVIAWQATRIPDSDDGGS